MASSFLNNANLPIGLRNNNPGNVRPLSNGVKWVGQIGVNKNFVVFSDVSYGIRAMVKNFITQYTRDNENTVRKYITAYAPPSDGNNTKAYIDSVAKALGVTPDQKLTITADIVKKLVRAHMVVELGQVHTKVTDSDIATGLSMVKLPGITPTTAKVVSGVALFFISIALITIVKS